MKKLIKLENLVLFSIIGLPLYLIRLDFFGFRSNILDILLLASAVWWFTVKKNKKSFISGYLRENREYAYAVALILMGLTISLSVNGNYQSGLGILKSWFVLPVLFSLAAADVFRERKVLIFKALCLSASITAAIALFYFTLGNLTFDGRLQAFFNSPNYLAMYLAPGFIIGLVLAQVQSPKSKVQSLYYLCSGVIAIAIYLTYSYAAWAAIVIAISVATFLNNKKSVKTLAAIVIVGLFLIFLQLGTQKWDNFSNLSERSSLSSRAIIWKASREIIADNAVWGIGPGNFQEKYLEYQKYFPPYLEWAVPHPHNVYLAFWLQAGLIGLFGFILAIIAVMKNIFKEENKELRFIVLGIMVYVLLHGLVDTTYFKNDLAVIFWLTAFSLNT